MVRRSGWMFLGMSALTCALAAWSGCRSDGTSSSANAGGSGGAGGSTTSSSSKSSTSGSTTSSSGSSSSGAGGGVVTTVDATIPDITTGKVGKGVKVKLSGVVAMSQKFLVSQGSTGSCLWGAFVSSPGLQETAPNTGTIILSYGTQASIPDGGMKAFCPRLGIDPIGDSIPDDLGPGDVIDVVGTTDKFLLSQCAMQPMGSTTSEFQVSKVSSVTRTMKKGPVPAPHAFTTPAEQMMLADPANQAFHDQWGGVKVAVSNVTSVPQMVMGMPSLTDQYGHIILSGSNLEVADKIYYRSYSKAQNFCYNGPVYANPMTTFTMVEGFSYLDYCTWSLEPNNKCSDLAPPSADPKDCNGNAMACP